MFALFALLIYCSSFAKADFTSYDRACHNVYKALSFRVMKGYDVAELSAVRMWQR